MESEHPIDAAIRDQLRLRNPNISELARQIQRKQSWLNKYKQGKGHASIDDAVRLLAALTGGLAGSLSEMETRLLRACRKLEEDDCLDVLAYAEHRARLARSAQSKESSEPVGRKPPATRHTRHGTR